MDYFLVKIIAAQMGVAADGLDLNGAFRNLQNRNIKRAAAEIVDHYLLFSKSLGASRRLTKTIRQRGRGGLV